MRDWTVTSVEGYYRMCVERSVSVWDQEQNSTTCVIQSYTVQKAILVIWTRLGEATREDLSTPFEMPARVVRVKITKRLRHHPDEKWRLVTLFLKVKLSFGQMHSTWACST